MAVSVETAKREMSSALIDIFKLRSAPYIPKVERCKTMVELRQVIFVILDDMHHADPERAKKLMAAWESLDDD